MFVYQPFFGNMDVGSFIKNISHKRLSITTNSSSLQNNPCTHNLYDLFTDGENLIALLGPSNTVDKGKKLYKIEFMVDDSVPEWIRYIIIPTRFGS